MTSLGLSVSMDYAQKRWNCEIRATLVPSLRPWGGSGDKMEDAVNGAVHEMAKDLLGEGLLESDALAKRLVER